MPRTILSVISTLAQTGPVNVLHGIVNNFDASRYRAVIATLSAEPLKSKIDDFRAAGIPVLELNLSRAESMLLGAQRIRKAVLDTRADLVHCHGFRADVLVGRSGLGCARVSTIHADLACDYSLAYGRFTGGLMARREYGALRRFDMAVGVSGTAAEAARRFGISAEVIENGIDINAFRPAPNDEARRDIQLRLGWPTDRKIFLHSGVLIARKRPLDVIAAFLQSGLTQNAELIFAGDGPLRPECEAAAGSHPNIRFLGSRSDMPELLRAADTIVSASSSEGLPMALLEACASGVRVIASDIRPHQEIAGRFPDQVRLFALGDRSQLANVLRASNTSVREIGRKDWRTISAEVMSSRYQDLYDRLLERRACAKAS